MRQNLIKFSMIKLSSYNYIFSKPFINHTVCWKCLNWNSPYNCYLMVYSEIILNMPKNKSSKPTGNKLNKVIENIQCHKSVETGWLGTFVLTCAFPTANINLYINVYLIFYQVWLTANGWCLVNGGFTHKCWLEWYNYTAVLCGITKTSVTVLLILYLSIQCLLKKN